MVIGNLDVVCIPVAPYEAHAIPLIDSDAVLPGAVVLQRLQGVARRAEILKGLCGMDLKQLPDRDLFDRLKLFAPDSYVVIIKSPTDFLILQIISCLKGKKLSFQKIDTLLNTVRIGTPVPCPGR
jgi:hypothetical protein